LSIFYQNLKLHVLSVEIKYGEKVNLD